MVFYSPSRNMALSSEEPLHLCVTAWKAERRPSLDEAPWGPSWRLTSHPWNMWWRARRSAISGSGSLGPLTSRACCSPCSRPPTWPSGSSTSSAGYLKPAFPRGVSSLPTTSSPNWWTKSRCYRTTSGSTRRPPQATRPCPAQKGPLLTKGGCIFRPLPQMIRLQNFFPPLFLSPL